MQSSKLALIGGGNMGATIARRLCERHWKPEQVAIADPSPEVRSKLATEGFQTTDDNAAAVANTSAVLLAVKPQVAPEVVPPLAALLRKRRPLLLSIVAGVGIARLNDWIGAELPWVRAMPNIPARIGAGITGLVAGPGVDPTQRQRATELFDTLGQNFWLDREELLDPITALTGAGPAYVFLLQEALSQAAEQLGFEPELAMQLAGGTVLGAAKLAAASAEPPAELRRQVSSPGGVTQAVVQHLRENDFTANLVAALHLGAERARELSRS